MINDQLAIHGGPKAVSVAQPHYVWPVITEAVEKVVQSQLHANISLYARSGVFEEFETQYAQYHGVKYAVLTNSGTSALHSMYVGADLGPEDEVICPAYTFFATVTPLLFTGALPVLCDADITGNIDPAEIVKKITPNTRAVVVTHMWGVPCKMDEIAAICKDHGLLLLEDCSHAHGARYRGTVVGAWGDAAAWSLQGQKIVTGGEGGIVTSNKEEIYYRSLLLGHYNPRCKREIRPDHPLYKYAVTGMGLKLRAHPLAIAIALEQFSHLDEWLDQKRVYANYMSERLKQLPGIYVPEIHADSLPAWYGFVFRYRAEDLDGLSLERFFEAIQAEGCSAADIPGSTCPLNNLALFQDPGPLFPDYRGRFAYHQGQFPVAEQFVNVVNLPVWAFPENKSTVTQYLDAIEKVVTNYKSLL